MEDNQQVMLSNKSKSAAEINAMMPRPNGLGPINSLSPPPATTDTRAAEETRTAEELAAAAEKANFHITNRNLVKEENKPASAVASTLEGEPINKYLKSANALRAPAEETSKGEGNDTAAGATNAAFTPTPKETDPFKNAAPAEETSKGEGNDTAATEEVTEDNLLGITEEVNNQGNSLSAPEAGTTPANAAPKEVNQQTVEPVKQEINEEQSKNGNNAKNDAKHIIVVDENISLQGLEKLSKDYEKTDETFMVMKPKNVQTIIESKPCNNPESPAGVSDINGISKNKNDSIQNPLHQGGNPQPQKRSMKRKKPKKKGAVARKTQMKIKQKKTRNKIRKQMRKTKRKR